MSPRVLLSLSCREHKQAHHGDEYVLDDGAVVNPLRSLSLSCREHKQAHHADEHVLDDGVVVHDDGHHADVGQVALRAANHVLLVDPALAR